MLKETILYHWTAYVRLKIRMRILAVFANSGQNLAYMTLNIKTCYIGSQRVHHGYTWLGANDITYTNWSAVVHLLDLKYGALSTDGRLLE